jgi:hypothetical protein
MHVFFLTLLVSLLVGGILGAVSGSQFGVIWTIGGLVVGVAIGLASCFSLSYAYVSIQISMELRSPDPRNWSVPVWWQLLYFPVSLFCFLLAGFGSWWVVHRLASLMAA